VPHKKDFHCYPSRKKTTAMLEKKLVPQLRFSEFDGVWNTTKISEVFTLFNGYAFSSSNALKSDGVLWVKIADVGIDNMKTDSLSYLPKEYVSTYKKFVLKEGDYVVALTRPILSGNLKIARINSYFDNSLLNQRVAKLLTNNNPTFVFNLLKRDKLIKSIENNIAGSDPPNLSPKDINHIIIKIPSIKEQQKIASFLTAVDTKLSQLTKKKALLENYKKGVMQQIFPSTGSGQVPEIRFKDNDGNDYGDWEEKKLGEILDYEQPTKYIVESTEYENSFKTPVLTAGKTFILGYTDENQGVFTNLPVIIFDDFTMANKYVNFAFKVKSSAMKILKPNSVDVNIKFIYESIQMINYPKGDEHKRFWISEYSKIKIGYPCLEEQTKIADFLSDLDIKIEVLSKSIENTQTFKKGVLQQLFV
jgi:type I restriction enzyme S subunit